MNQTELLVRTKFDEIEEALLLLAQSHATLHNKRIGLAIAYRVDGGLTRVVLSEDIITTPSDKKLPDRAGEDALYSIYATTKALDALLQQRHTARLDTTSPLGARHEGGRYKLFNTLGLHLGVGVSGLKEDEDVAIAKAVMAAIGFS